MAEGGSIGIVNTLIQGVQQMSAMVAAIKSVFPQQTGTSTTATGGAGTLPANPAGFMIVTLPSGATVKVPYYNQ